MNLTQFGHNETAVRLGMLANDAQLALARVSAGESTAIEGWLAYGAALNAGRAMFAGDREFGQWVAENVLYQVGNALRPEDQIAAMWAAANPDQFDTARAASNARTVRGIHAKWGEIDAERKGAEERAKAEIERAKAQAERKEADAARAKAEADRRQAEADRLEAVAKVQAEEEALIAEQLAIDEQERKEARYRAEKAAQERVEAEARAKAADDAAKAADEQANASDKAATLYDKAAQSADKSAAAADKKAAKVKSGNMADEKTAHVSHNSGENEWYTPVQFVEAARIVLGGFDLDPASCEVANRTVKAAKIFTAEDDGLAQDWPVGSIWMNPPYAQPLMGQFADKFAKAVRSGSKGIVLVNNATETNWFQTIAAECTAICFPKSRIRFLDPHGNPGAPLQGQAIIYAGPNPKAFCDEFSQFGLVVSHGQV